MRQPPKPWEAIGISRATWYRLGKPTEEPIRPVTLREMAEAFGISLRTIQRDKARALREAARTELRKAEAEGREPDENAFWQQAMTQFAAKCDEREARLMKAVSDGLERLQRLSTIK